ncbi:hypothetical protein KDL01_24860 [Actinospica durhamensis]|uniref:DUF4232 domain-containing protein n=1 Tax=Actinospica durhamensis TaxID=1508375 RepID=A0A941ITW5_9ACTN|nr:hypothetical protein [Actinospica durhamensis]MBR7836533.1 hypothetical protein [Actinospica durhamensis]
MQRFQSVALAGVALACAVTLAGCGTSARDAASARAQGADGASAAATAPAGSPTARPPSTASARVAPLPISGPCTNAQLSVTAAGRRTLPDLQIERFLATDTAAVACSLTGSPRLTPTGPLASSPSVTSDIAVSQEDFDGDDEGGSATTRVDLQPGQAAAFDVAWYAASPVVCEQATGFGFSVPGDSSWSGMRQVGYRFGSMCDGLFYVSTLRTPTP